MNNLTRLLIPIAALASKLFAQTPRVEAGLHLGATDARVLGEKPLAAGGTFTVHLFRFVDAEAGVTRFPIGGTVALFPATQATFGARLGRRWGPLGLYGKVRPGFTRFDTNAYVPNLGTRPALDIGGILEFYSHRHFAARVDFGDRRGLVRK